MAKDDIFRIIYIILKELYENKKDGKRTPKENTMMKKTYKFLKGVKDLAPGI